VGEITYPRYRPRRGGIGLKTTAPSTDDAENTFGEDTKEAKSESAE